MSNYGVNSGVPKSLVKHLVSFYASTTDNKQVSEVLLDILDTPISPELLPADKNGEIAQKTEDLVGPYELHDFFLFHFLRNCFSPTKILKLATLAFDGKYEPATIYKWLESFYKRFFSQQFKRSCLPDGVKVGSVCLSPRGDWRMPSDATASLWLSELREAEEALKNGTL
jgi:NAD+ synthase (glutamine-hydrolysing)